MAYERIRQAIIEGQYQPGQRLIEQRIAEQFGLSRTPVRESLRRIESEGLIHSEANRGAIVRSLTVEEIADLYGLRARLESYAAEMAASRATHADLTKMDHGIALFGEAMRIATTDPLERLRAIHRANGHVHQAIIDSASHWRLTQLLTRTVDAPLVFQAFQQYDHAQTERSHLFHQLIRDAIAAGEATRAARLMSEHVLQGRDVLILHLQQSSHTEPDSNS